MRLYWEVARRGFRRYATYRGATFAGVFTNTVFGFMRTYVFLAVLAVRPHAGGFDRPSLLAYAWASQGMIMIVYLWGWNEVALRIKSGDIASDLCRPYDFQMYWLANDYGRALYHAIFRGIPPFIIAGLFFHLRTPGSLVVWLAFGLTLATSLSVSFALRFLTNLTAFWLLDNRGVQALAASAWTFLSGFIVPLTFFPTSLAKVLRMLPFAAMFQVPMEVFVGKRHGWPIAAGIAFGVVWTLVLLGVGRVVLARAERRLVTQGG